MDSSVEESNDNVFQPIGEVTSAVTFSGSAQATKLTKVRATAVGNVIDQLSAEVLITSELGSVRPFSTTVRDVEEFSVMTMVLARIDWVTSAAIMATAKLQTILVCIWG
jgi:hypothetical protein